MAACRLVDKKNARRYDDCLSYTMVASKKALRAAGLEKEANPEGYDALDKTRVGVLVGTGMGGLQVFQDGVKALVEKGPKKITPFFIPYAITNMCVACYCICLLLQMCAVGLVGSIYPSPCVQLQDTS